ncbi:MAG: tetratricopeptide repeat protein, partial [Methanomicrobiales archaeon]|nr:tetratricopeptide repeat protein [Methanomicrobiales archaeon]
MILPRYGPVLVGFLVLLTLICIPTAAYSEEATRAFDEGTDLMIAEDYSGAIASFDRAISLEPRYFEAWDKKADALNRAGELSEAKKVSEKSLEINPDYVRGWINRGQILYNIGYYYEDVVGDQKKAEEYYLEQLLAFEQAVQLEPGNAEAHFNRGYALAGMKRYDEALAEFERVRSLDPTYPNLALSEKQARVLRDAATPWYMQYAVPLGALVLVGILIVAYFVRVRQRDATQKDSAATENRRARRRKEQ